MFPIKMTISYVLNPPFNIQRYGFVKGEQVLGPIGHILEIYIIYYIHNHIWLFGQIFTPKRNFGAIRSILCAAPCGGRRLRDDAKVIPRFFHFLVSPKQALCCLWMSFLISSFYMMILPKWWCYHGEMVQAFSP